MTDLATTNKTTTQLLAEIGIRHEATTQPRFRRLFIDNGRTLEFASWSEANALYRMAQSAA